MCPPGATLGAMPRLGPIVGNANLDPLVSLKFLLGKAAIFLLTVAP